MRMCVFFLYDIFQESKSVQEKRSVHDWNLNVFTVAMHPAGIAQTVYFLVILSLGCTLDTAHKCRSREEHGPETLCPLLIVFCPPPRGPSAMRVGREYESVIIKFLFRFFSLLLSVFYIYN